MTRRSVSAVDLLPVKNDYVFSRLFGAESHRRVLVCLLNSILNGHPHIESVTLDPTEYKKTSKDGKSIRLDIAATTDNGTRINVEIQCYNTDNIEDRAAFYRYQLQERELHAGDDYSSVPNVISIWITTENATNRKGCVNEIVPMYKDNGVDKIEIASEKMRHFIIELAKLEATPKRFLNDMFTVWMRFIKDPNSIPPEFLNIPEVKEAMDELTVISMDSEARAEYYARLKELNDIQAVKTVSERKVKVAEEKLAKAEEEKAKAEEEKAKAEEEKAKAEEEKAKAEEEKAKAEEEKAKAEEEKAKLEEKAKQEKLETAKAFLKMGLSIEQVAQGVGLSIEQVKKLSV